MASGGSFQYETVLFDVDGTLIDSNDAHAESFSRAFVEHGFRVAPADVRPLVGMGADKVLERLAGLSDASETGQAISRRKKDIFSSLLRDLQPTRGARSLVQYLRDLGINVAVATSASEEEMHAILRQAQLDDLFQAHANKDDAEESKPDPDIVHAAIARAGARPESTVMIGDTPYDVEAGRRAGIGVIALRCGGYWKDGDLGKADGIFDDPGALLAHWRGSVQGAHPGAGGRPCG